MFAQSLARSLNNNNRLIVNRLFISSLPIEHRLANTGKRGSRGIVAATVQQLDYPFDAVLVPLAVGGLENAVA